MAQNNKKARLKTALEREKVPDNLVEALISIIWGSKWRKIYILGFGLLMTVFAVWTSLPDSLKEQFLTGNIGVTKKNKTDQPATRLRDKSFWFLAAE